MPRTPQQQAKRRARAARRAVSPFVSPVTVTRPDGTVEVQDAYTRKQAEAIAEQGVERSHPSRRK